MLKIGLTGGIGSGKSIVAGIFEVLGVPVFYADDAAKRLMNTDEEIKSELRRQFGDDVYLNGELNRKWLAGIVFTDKKKLERLNAITHPATIRDANTWIEMHASAGDKAPPYIIKEAALLFESGSAKQLDYIIGVYAPLPVRVGRVMKRDGLTEKEVLGRISRQMDENLKMKQCDFVIINSEEELVIPQVIELHEKFKVMAVDSRLPTPNS